MVTMAFYTRTASTLTRFSLSQAITADFVAVRQLHANRASICRIKRPPNEYCRQYPVTIVFQDGSTIAARHQLPREIIKLPFTLEQCQSALERKAWMGRRKPKEIIEIKKDDTDVAYNQMDYLKAMQSTKGPKAKAKK